VLRVWIWVGAAFVLNLEVETFEEAFAQDRFEEVLEETLTLWGFAAR